MNPVTKAYDPIIFCERKFMAWKTVLKVPHALDKPADLMPVFVAIICSGNNRAFAVVFSLS